MQYANDITLAAFKAGLATLREGMTQGELGGNITAAYRQMGASGAIAVSFGEYTAFPHGSIEPQRLKEGDVVQIDDGVSWNGYQSDITRTTVFGKPTRAADRGVEPREEGAGGGVRRGAGRRRRASRSTRRRAR